MGLSGNKLEATCAIALGPGRIQMENYRTNRIRVQGWWVLLGFRCVFWFRIVFLIFFVLVCGQDGIHNDEQQNSNRDDSTSSTTSQMSDVMRLIRYPSQHPWGSRACRFANIRAPGVTCVSACVKRMVFLDGLIGWCVPHSLSMKNTKSI